MVKKAIVSIVLVLSVVLFSNCSYAEEKGLLGYWKFDEGKGDIAKDFSGKGNDGTIYGAVATAGKIGQALSFDGVGNYVDCGKTAGNLGTDPFTIECWVKSENNEASYFIEKRQKDGHQWLFTLSVGKPYFNYNDGNSNYAYKVSNTVLQQGQWYHLAAVVDRPSSYLPIIYVNGVVGKGRIGQHGNPETANMDNTGNLYFGRNTYRNAKNYFNGSIDEVRIYNRALTETEIKNHYENENPSI